MSSSRECVEERLRELEIKITFLDDYVAEQNRTILEQSREIEKLKRALKMLEEKTDALDAGGNVPPANEKPPHW